MVVFDSYHDIALTVLEGFDGSDSKPAGKNAVLSSRDTSALEMPEDGDAGFEFRIFMHKTVGIIMGTSGPVFLALGYQNDRTVLALADSAPDECRQLVDVGLVLRNDGSLGTGGNGGVLCKETGIPPHDLNEENTVMRVCRVAYLVDAVHDGVERRVVSDGIVRSIQVIVNCARQPDTWDIILRGDDLRPRKGTVPSDDYKRIDTVCLYVFIRLGTSFLIHEILAAGRTQDCAAAVDDAADAFRCKILYFVIDEAFPAPIYAFHFPAVVNRGSCHGSNCRIHSRRVTSRCQHPYCSYLCHNNLHDKFVQIYLIFLIFAGYMNIGNIELGEKPLFLAPMEDVTDASFRFVCKEFGADMMYTEFISSDGLIRDARKSLEKLVTHDYEAPIGIQIYGNIPEAMVDAAKMAEQAAQITAQLESVKGVPGAGYGADLIDINFGCPVNKIARRGAGSGMMREPDKMVQITRMVVDAVRLPVTVKTRLGWDEDSKIIVELAERLQDVGIQALTIHGRTRCQMYKGEADWTLIGKVKENPRMHIPIIGNGDINSPEKAKEYFDRYGVDGIMIGRATYGHPWIFKEIKHYLQTGELLPQMSVADRVALAKKHLAKSLEIKGDKVGILEMRRHLSCYFKGLPDFKETRLKLVTLNDPEELYSTLDYIAERWGADDAPMAANVYGI